MAHNIKVIISGATHTYLQHSASESSVALSYDGYRNLARCMLFCASSNGKATLLDLTKKFIELRERHKGLFFVNDSYEPIFGHGGWETRDAKAAIEHSQEKLKGIEDMLSSQAEEAKRRALDRAANFYRRNLTRAQEIQETLERRDDVARQLLVAVGSLIDQSDLSLCFSNSPSEKPLGVTIATIVTELMIRDAVILLSRGVTVRVSEETAKVLSMLAHNDQEAYTSLSHDYSFGGYPRHWLNWFFAVVRAQLEGYRVAIRTNKSDATLWCGCEITAKPITII